MDEDLMEMDGWRSRRWLKEDLMEKCSPLEVQPGEEQGSE